MRLILDDVKIHHYREAFNFLDILGYIGGLTRAFTQIFGIFFVVYSKNSLFMKLASELFVLKSDDAAIFDRSIHKKVKSAI